MDRISLANKLSIFLEINYNILIYPGHKNTLSNPVITITGTSLVKCPKDINSESS